MNFQWDKDRKELIKYTVLSIIIFVVIVHSVGIVRVYGSSMNPSLSNKSYVLINKIDNKFRRGDIVVFNSDLKTLDGRKKRLVKRIIATPGDNIKIKDSNVFINGEKLYENYLVSQQTDGEVDLWLNGNEFFLMGDNRDVSMDSRDRPIGIVCDDKFIGKVFFKIGR